MEEYFRRVFPGSAEEFCKKAESAMESGRRMFVVTANPEILMAAGRDEKARELLLSAEAEIVPDGISVVKAMGMLGLPVTERITGVDLADKLLHSAGRSGKSVYLLGAKEEVVSTLAKNLKAHYPAMTLHYHNGYDGDKDSIMKEIAILSPDLVLVGLGVPAQEFLIHRHLQDFTKGVLMGVGGSFDVLSGMKRRAPALFVKTNTEWLYRILREPSRLKRFWRSNVKFLGEVRKAARK
ncbi:MAG: WecB/TagA/CpsF family glycosyltransferase [Acutalibacter sp.]|nr:WecB/TagA/CpsF family glycosyltransferase [Acutalibacter sp.]